MRRLFGFADGGVNSSGQGLAVCRGSPLAAFRCRPRSSRGEAGPEAAVPLPDGRRIPVESQGAEGSLDGSSIHLIIDPK